MANSENHQNVTPMMKQYLEIKKEYSDTVLFFRMGDFYEMFNEDAVYVARVLNITLTSRAGYQMCGFPYHAAGNYIKRLLKDGHKIAICEQVSEPGQGKIVERKVVRVLTPGTLVEDDYLEQNSNNYISAAAITGDYLSFSWIDISTGEFWAASFPASQAYEILKREIFRTHTRELLIQESILSRYPQIENYLNSVDALIVNKYPDWSFNQKSSFNALTSHFKTASLKGFGIDDDYPGIYTCGLLLGYLEETSLVSLKHINHLFKYQPDDYLIMDEATLKNLEILRNLQDGSTGYTLFKVLNYTKTSCGSRLLKKWLVNPLVQKEAIFERQLRVSFFVSSQMLLFQLRDQIGKVLDIQRLATRLSMDKAHAKDLLALGQSLRSFLEIRDLINAYDDKSMFFPNFPDFYALINEIAILIEQSIHEEPSILLTEGRIIRKGYSQELDHLNELKENSQGLLAKYLEDEKTKTGINNLKLKYNRVIGYFLEVTKGNQEMVPSYFIRRQSLVGNERYSTEALGELEVELSGANEKAVTLEKSLFLEVRNQIKTAVEALYRASTLISELDVYQSLSWAATTNQYVCPAINEGNKSHIIFGRHPVVERSLKDDLFVPNSLSIDGSNNSFIMITGPNMAGKSTLLRQVALIVLMTQVGSFVPAQSAEMGIVDKIFCRVGASDNLARGESTFLVEMNETANILRNATKKSLVIMDEVGRGTSTNDGLSIAWAVSEALLKLGARTLFATHYHELTLLENPALSNKSMKVMQERDQIIFMKELIDGPAGSSYGIYVAKLAGIPSSIINRAKEVMSHLESQTQLEMTHLPKAQNIQTQLFSPQEMLLERIASYQLYQKTPIEVMQDLSAWQEEIKKL